MSLVIPMVIYIQQHLAKVADKAVAANMQQTLRVNQPCYGVNAEQRSEIFKDARAHTKIDNAENYRRLLLWLWSGVYREERYLALDAGEYYHAFRNEHAFHTYQEMLETVDGVDIADRLVEQLISPVVLGHREFESKLIEWRESDNKWLKRASLLAHCHHKQHTNVDLLCETVLLLADDSDYEVQQAIGLVLRNYSETDFPFVDHFLISNIGILTPQARREARKLTLGL
ncbi:MULTISPECIES: DNA alkylation repair protein [unclassified Photobacterium]|uniref:DNA alkylation repair protein n=1 Tax=unclassified Photobacterium TaxID=2628852 RepID=UPI000D16FCED|nr:MULTISPECIES: DNA alkylation repair protein [unclassified Photobacterium]PSV35370.1 DNA alkylation repair protein [Photobacterium sp. GB-27]PSV36299.1 DNA alkylation repair protein [Photobacterium sp. GB-210]PSV42121.1 DNA alkylation repair protein [Photobacterium sp. GB-36]PSV50781.1 DNA alkylation repair protein [Photobacterium sp. GB-1]PSV54465.1 DNA alkylation repair protein [Photobacterium sp. GB-3]